MRWWDVEAVAASSASCSRTTRGRSSEFWTELAGVPETRWYVVAEDDCRRRRLRRACSSVRPRRTCRPSRSRRGRRATASARALLDALVAEARASRLHAAVRSRCAPTTRPRIALYERRGFERHRTSSAATTATGSTPSCCVDGSGVTPRERRRAAGPRHRDVVRRDRCRASCAARRCSPTRSRAASTSTRGSAVSCPRSRPARTSRRWSRRSIARARRPASRSRDVDAIAVTAGPGLAGALLVGVACGEGAGAVAGQAALRRQPPGGARRRRPARARAAARADDRAARVRRALVAAARARRDERRAAARRDDRRRRGRGVRQGRARCSGCRSRAGRTSTASREGRRDRDRLPARSHSGRDMERHRYDFSFSGLKTAVARWVEAREASGEPRAGGRCRGLVPGGRRRRAHPQGASSRARSTASGTSSSAAVWRRTRGCARWPRSVATQRASSCGCRARVCAPTTARWSRRSVPRWSAGGGCRARWGSRQTRRCPSRR